MVQEPDSPAVLYVDLHLVHEVTSPQAFALLKERGLAVRRSDRTVATMDHSTPTTPRGADGKIAVTDPIAAKQLAQLEANCRDFGIELFGLDSPEQGIVHQLQRLLGAHLHCQIARLIDNGFAMTIAATARKRDKLAAQLTWLANRHILNITPSDTYYGVGFRAVLAPRQP